MTGSKVANTIAVVKALYKDQFAREFVRNLTIFGIGVWIAREFSGVEVMAPQPA